MSLNSLNRLTTVNDVELNDIMHNNKSIVLDIESGVEIKSIREMIEQRSLLSPEKTFLISTEGEEPFDFNHFHLAVKEIASTVINNTNHGDKVATLLANGPNSAIALLGVIYAGRVAIPINPKLRESEIEWPLKNSGAVILITDEINDTALSEKVRSGIKQIHNGYEKDNNYIIYRLSRKHSQDEFRDKHWIPSWDDPAMMIYTSGTTGDPKGVILTHGNFLMNMSFVRHAHRLGESDTALCILPLYHINAFVFTLLTPILSGGKVVIPKRFSVSSFWKWVSCYKATWFSAVPTILSFLLSEETPAEQDISSLRFARSASAPLPPAVMDEFERRFKVPVIECYGISEGAGQITATPLPPGKRKHGSAGIAVGNELAVIDENGNFLAPGKTGEIVLRGENIFSGYHNNPQADAEAFKNGWFHTGDLGYLDDEGYIFLTGRKKEIINRAGEKITPREVEEVIYQLQEVESAGVVGVPNPLFNEEVVAFVTIRPGCAVEPGQIISFCRKHLADFKAPKEVFIIDELPKGPNGKIQRRKLVEIYKKIKSV